MSATRAACSTRRWAGATVVVALLSAAPLDAQSAPPPSTIGGALATRAELEAQSRAARDAAASPSLRGAERLRREYEAVLLEARLRDGDFQSGDRVVVEVKGEAALNDTVVVRDGPALRLGELPEVTLVGVLRSEIATHLREHIARFVRDPDVRVVPLVRLAVLGQVQRPGYYAVAADAQISDLFATAGGLVPSADLGRVEVRRGGRRLWSPGELRTVMTQGGTVDQLHMRAGDEIVVGERSRRSLGTTLQAVSMLTGAIALAFSLSR